MCQRATCASCKRPTFMGCGAHVEQVLRDVPSEDRCKCRETKADSSKSSAGAKEDSWLRSIFTR